MIDVQERERTEQELRGESLVEGEEQGAHAENGDRALKPGAFAQVHLNLGDKTSGQPEIVVPGSAILYGAAGPQVAVVDGQGHVTMHSVAIARDKGSTVLLSSGVTANDHVIDSPPDAVRTGDTVRVQQVVPVPADPAPKPAPTPAAKG